MGNPAKFAGMNLILANFEAIDRLNALEFELRLKAVETREYVTEGGYSVAPQDAVVRAVLLEDWTVRQLMDYFIDEHGMKWLKNYKPEHFTIASCLKGEHDVRPS
jgi:hypothetical protein